MAGTPLDAASFADFYAATGLANINKPTQYIVDAQRYRTYDWPRLAGGNVNGARRIQGGARIKFQTVLRTLGNGESYLLGQPVPYNEQQTLTEAVADWRFQRTHVSWTEGIVLLNEALTMGRDEFVFQQFVDLRDKFDADLNLDMMDLLESSLWAPGTALMEGQGATKKVPYSIDFHINEETNGLKTGVTTKEGVAPGDKLDLDGASLWKPQIRKYTTAVPGAAGNLLTAFRRIFMDIEFQVPEGRAQYYESPVLSKQIIKTSPEGVEHYMFLLERGQDSWVAGKQDAAYNEPQFMGVPVSRSDAFGRGLYYDGNTVDQFGGTNKGPRYLFENGNYLFPVLHREKAFKKTMPRSQYEVIDRWSVVLQIWWNLVCTSYRRQGHVGPTGSVITA